MMKPFKINLMEFLIVYLRYKPKSFVKQSDILHQPIFPSDDVKGSYMTSVWRPLVQFSPGEKFHRWPVGLELIVLFELTNVFKAMQGSN